MRPSPAEQGAAWGPTPEVTPLACYSGGRDPTLVAGTPDQQSHTLSLHDPALLPGNQGALLQGTAVHKSGTKSKASSLTGEQGGAKKFNNEIKCQMVVK